MPAIQSNSASQRRPVRGSSGSSGPSTMNGSVLDVSFTGFFLSCVVTRSALPSSRIQSKPSPTYFCSTAAIASEVGAVAIAALKQRAAFSSIMASSILRKLRLGVVDKTHDILDCRRRQSSLLKRQPQRVQIDISSVVHGVNHHGIDVLVQPLIQ